MAHGDLGRPDLEELDWSPGERLDSLSAVFNHAVGLANGAEEWYARKRRAKRRWGRALRVGAIVLGATAAVLPILTQIYTKDDKPTIPPGWAAVALAAAAALIALDRYFGFSAGWMRFMAAELKITRLRHGFEYGWQAARAAAAAPPSDDEVAELLTRARELALAIDDVIAEETGGWILEFQTNLERAEQSLRASDRV
jgi:4-amino-4-deoxy-L-arabinose transferase-like glycosyltransferase